ISETVKNEFDRVVADAGGNNPEVVLARGNYVSLPTRLEAEKTELTQQLAQKATKEELKNIGDASPKVTYPTLADLEADFPQGSTGIYIVTSNGNWYYWNSEAWTPGGLYQSMGIDDKSISEDKVTFIESGKNLFN